MKNKAANFIYTDELELQSHNVLINIYNIVI